MRKPSHAHSNAPLLTVTVFEKGKRHAIIEATGTDPSNIAQQVSLHEAITDTERSNVRLKLRTALDKFRDKVIPNMTDCQIDVGGRRLRIREAA